MLQTGKANEVEALLAEANLTADTLMAILATHTKAPV